MSGEMWMINYSGVGVKFAPNCCFSFSNPQENLFSKMHTSIFQGTLLLKFKFQNVQTVRNGIAQSNMASTKTVWRFANLCQYANQSYKNGRYPKKYSKNGKVATIVYLIKVVAFYQVVYGLVYQMRYCQIIRYGLS